MSTTTITRRSALRTIGGTVVALAAAAILPVAPAFAGASPVPLRTLDGREVRILDLDQPGTIVAALLVFEHQSPVLGINVRDAGTRAEVIRWAQRQLDRGHLAGFVFAGELAA